MPKSNRYNTNHGPEDFLAAEAVTTAEHAEYSFSHQQLTDLAAVTEAEATHYDRNAELGQTLRAGPLHNVIDRYAAIFIRCAALHHDQFTQQSGDGDLARMTIGSSDLRTRRTVTVCRGCQRHMDNSGTIAFVLGGFVVQFTAGDLPRPMVRQLSTKQPR